MLLKLSIQSMEIFFLGTFGDIGCFSFSPNKIITTGQGGIIVTNNKKIYNYIKMFKNQGRSETGTGGDDEHFIKGSNLRLTNLQAAIGLSQLKKLKKRAKILKYNYLYYKKKLSSELRFFKFRKEEIPLWTDVFFYKRDILLDFLKKKKIDCRKFWKPMLEQKAYSQKDKKNDFLRNLFWLPSSFQLKNKQREYVVKTIKKFNNINEK